jgi:NhaP-type Na+/H+ or K+/H+ antiporter
LHKFIHQIEEKRQAIFVGFFGPIGVSAIFYLYISLEFLEGITVDGVQRSDANELGQVITVIVWFLAICSIVSSQVFLFTTIAMLWVTEIS